MKPGVRYIVTKGSNDGTFGVGCHIHLHDDGSIICREAAGWIDPEHVDDATEGTQYEIDAEWAEKRKREIKAELRELGG